MIVLPSRPLVAFFGFVLVGCGGSSEPASETSRAGGPSASAGPPVEFRGAPARAGRLSLLSGSVRFVACGDTGQGAAVEDASGAGKAAVDEFGGKGVMAVVRLEGNRLQEVRYAAPEGPGCDQLPPHGEVEARGNEPFWLIRVDGATAYLRRPQNPEEQEYERGAWSQPAPSTWRYDAERDRDGKAQSLTLELSEARCTDSMSGAWYPFRAVIVRNGRKTEGCALEGRQSFRQSP